MANKNFFAGLFKRRATIQKGPDYSDMKDLLQQVGYKLVVGPDGTTIPMPADLDPSDNVQLENMHDKWSMINSSAIDLVGNRIKRLNAYKKMDRSGSECSLTLDVLADEVVNITDYSDSSLSIQISDSTLRGKVMQILSDNNVLDNIRSDIRALVKNGDYVYTVTRTGGNRAIQITEEDAKNGASLKVPLSPEDLVIQYHDSADYTLEGSKHRVYKLKIEQVHQDSSLPYRMDDFDPWEFSLFSINSRDTYPYGLSELEKMRLPWEKLTILEELLAITRANRLDRIAISVPGTKGDPASVLARLSQMKNTIRSIVLGSSGNRLSRNQDTGMTEYLWIPEGFKAEKLSTSLEVSTIEDVEYFRDKLINASRLPKGFFLASEGNGQQRPLSLRQQDIKFARSLIPVGEAYCVGMKKLITLLVFYLGGDISRIKIDVKFKKSPYISGELMQTYKDAYDIVRTYKELKSQFSEETEITDVDMKRLLDLIGMPHELLFSQKDANKTSIQDSIDRITNKSNKALAPSTYPNLMEVTKIEI